MILVKRQGEATSQKVISSFQKRAKKYNIIARKRKTQHFLPAPSKLVQKRKAIRMNEWFKNSQAVDKNARKI